VEANGHPLDALGDPTRRQVFELLRRGPRSVGELAEHMPVSRPAVSQHLRVLEDAGLVTHRRNGTRNLYELDGTGVAELRAWVDDFWTDALARFKAVAEERADEKGAS
jgi:DNA-binding transcriptional ArsR family regulator